MENLKVDTSFRGKGKENLKSCWNKKFSSAQKTTSWEKGVVFALFSFLSLSQQLNAWNVHQNVPHDWKRRSLILISTPFHKEKSFNGREHTRNEKHFGGGVSTTKHGAQKTTVQSEFKKATQLWFHWRSSQDLTQEEVETSEKYFTFCIPKEILKKVCR